MDSFDSCPDRRGTGSTKWDRWAGRDVIPMWVADMDCLAPEPVLAALRARVEHGVLGYRLDDGGIPAALAEWLARRHGWRIDPSWVVPLPGVVVGIHLFLAAVGQPGDGHLCPTPVYQPFLSAPAQHGQRLLAVPLTEDARGFRLEASALAAANDARTRSVLLCQPQNPTGRVLDAEELAAVAEHARRHDLWVLSDEIWADLVLDGAHRPFALAAPDLAARTVTLLAPSKTFNIPGLGAAAAVIPDPALRRRFTAAGRGLVPHVGLLGFDGAVAAWSTDGAWVDSLLAHLRRNRDLVGATIARLPELRWHPPQATYLAWIDARAATVTDPFAHALAHGLGLADGRIYGAPGWLRLNFGCPRSTLEEGLARLAKAFG
jgi:cystathionine beta-lyase